MDKYTKKANMLLTEWKNAGKNRFFKGGETDNNGYFLTLTEQAPDSLKVSTMVSEKEMIKKGLLDSSLDGGIKLLMIVDHVLAEFSKSIFTVDSEGEKDDLGILEKLTATHRSTSQALWLKVNLFIAGGDVTKKEIFVYPYCDWLFLSLYCWVILPLSFLWTIPLIIWGTLTDSFRWITRKIKK